MLHPESQHYFNPVALKSPSKNHVNTEFMKFEEQRLLCNVCFLPLSSVMRRWEEGNLFSTITALVIVSPWILHIKWHWHTVNCSFFKIILIWHLKQLEHWTLSDFYSGNWQISHLVKTLVMKTLKYNHPAEIPADELICLGMDHTVQTPQPETDIRIPRAGSDNLKSFPQRAWKHLSNYFSYFYLTVPLFKSSSIRLMVLSFNFKSFTIQWLYHAPFKVPSFNPLQNSEKKLSYQIEYGH